MASRQELESPRPRRPGPEATGNYPAHHRARCRAMVPDAGQKAAAGTGERGHGAGRRNSRSHAAACTWPPTRPRTSQPPGEAPTPEEPGPIPRWPSAGTSTRPTTRQGPAPTPSPCHRHAWPRAAPWTSPWRSPRTGDGCRDHPVHLRMDRRTGFAALGGSPNTGGTWRIPTVWPSVGTSTRPLTCRATKPAPCPVPGHV